MRHAFNDAFDADERKLIEAALTESIEVKESPKRLHFDVAAMPAWRMKPVPKTSRTITDGS